MARSAERNPLPSTGVTRRTFSKAAAGGVAGVALGVGARSRRFHAVAQGSGLSGKVSTWAYPLGSIGDDGNTAMWDELISQFTTEYPDIEIDFNLQPWDKRSEKIATSVAAGANPDVLYFNDDYIPTYGPDFLEPLDDVISEDRDDFVELGLNNLTEGGALYALPLLGTVNATLYNSRLFEELGLSEFPEDWDAVTELGPAFRDAGYFVTSYNGSIDGAANLSYYPLLWQAGGEVLNEDQTAAAVNSDAGLDALNFVISLFQSEFVDMDEALTPPQGQTGLFYQGRVGMLMVGEPTHARSIDEILGEGTAKVGPPLTRAMSTNYGTTAGFGVFRNAPDVDAAKAWVRFLTTGEAAERLLRSGGYMPQRVSLQGMYADDPILSEYEKYVDMMHPGIHHPAAPQMQRAVMPVIQAAFLGEQSAEEALSTLEADINRLLERA